MTYQIGLNALNLIETPRVARTEYLDNFEIVRHVTGKDPRMDEDANRAFYDAIGIDFLWSTDEGPEPWSKRGRVTDMGHASYMEGGTDFHAGTPCPFKSTDEVLAFDAVAEYGLTDFDKLVAYYDGKYDDARRRFPQQVVTGGYYNTLVSGAIQVFGWQMLLEAIGDGADRFGEKVLGSIFDQTMHHARAISKTRFEFYMCHDDMVWSSGAFVKPAFYRAYIFPRYKELFAMLHAAGKKVLYTSDGLYDFFMDDIVAAGADGLVFEPMNDLELIVQKYGRTHALLGGADCRTLTFGKPADIEAEVRAQMKLARECPGFVYAAGNHFPENIPLENGLAYLSYVETYGRRG
jgi:hypothetical protein